MATWAQVRAKVLHVEAVNSPTLAHIAGDIPLPEFKARFNAFPDWRESSSRMPATWCITTSRADRGADRGVLRVGAAAAAGTRAAHCRVAVE